MVKGLKLRKWSSHRCLLKSLKFHRRTQEEEGNHSPKRRVKSLENLPEKVSLMKINLREASKNSRGKILKLDLNLSHRMTKSKKKSTRLKRKKSPNLSLENLQRAQRKRLLFLKVLSKFKMMKRELFSFLRREIWKIQTSNHKNKRFQREVWDSQNRRSKLRLNLLIQKLKKIRNKHKNLHQNKL